tara:strand:+ start:100604 stop:101632 length:1029 start_codon:yes stop_codon:yes gene_type:complete
MRILQRITVLLSAGLFLLSSCGDKEENQMLMSISGNPGEVILVATQNQWEGQIGEKFQSHFLKPVYGMPQDEPLFNVVRTNYSDFERVFKTFRNVIILEIDTNRFSKGEITYHKNVWAKGQLVIKMIASSRQEVLDLLDENADQMIRIIQTKEFNRLYSKYKAHPNNKIQKKLVFNLGVKMVIPKEAVIANIDSAHAWIRIEREKLKGGYQHQISQAVLIYKYRYTAKQQFLDENLFAKRDSVLKAYIPGPSEGSFMTTEYRYQPPITKDMDYQGHFAKEIHGLWRMENDFMGGPMATYFILNEEEGMIYCVSGYAYAPQFDKREYYREIEAIARSVSFLKK